MQCSPLAKAYRSPYRANFRSPYRFAYRRTYSCNYRSRTSGHESVVTRFPDKSQAMKNKEKYKKGVPSNPMCINLVKILGISLSLLGIKSFCESDFWDLFGGTTRSFGGPGQQFPPFLVGKKPRKKSRLFFDQEPVLADVQTEAEGEPSCTDEGSSRQQRQQQQRRWLRGQASTDSASP